MQKKKKKWGGRIHTISELSLLLHGLDAKFQLIILVSKTNRVSLDM